MKTPNQVLRVLAFCAILWAATAGLCAAEGQPPLYIALFRLTVGEDHRLQEFQVVKVIDLLSGSNNPASIELPPAFIDRARKTVEGEHLQPAIRDGKPTSTLASFVFSPADDRPAPPGIAFAVLDGAMNHTSDFRLLGQEAAVSTYGANFGRSAFFVGYYAVSALPKTSRDQRTAIVEAEIQRSTANVQNAEILSRKDLSTDTQAVLEITCKSPRNKALTIRSRYICNDRQMLSFTAITPDGLPVEDAQSFDRLFDAFRFR